jgi:Anti-sigma-K factor rskA
MADSARRGHPDLAAFIFELPGAEDRQGVQAHLRQCESCAREVEEMGGLPALIGAAAPSVGVPPKLEGRVLDAVRSQETPDQQRSGAERRVEGRSARRRLGTAPAIEAVGRAALVRLGVAGVGKRLWGPGIAVAVAALLVVAGTGLAMERLTQGSPAPGAASPAARTVKLVAADGSAASGIATIQQSSGGQVVELRVEGLADTSPGQLYVCWLVDEGDSMQNENRVPVGTFSVSGTGPVTVRWSTGADAAHYRLDVTREQADGNPLRRGPEVLTAVS